MFLTDNKEEFDRLTQTAEAARANGSGEDSLLSSSSFSSHFSSQSLPSLLFSISALFPGPIRINDYSPSDPFKVDPSVTGMDLVDDPAVIQQHFGFVSPDAKYMKHVRCAGYMNVARLGEYLLQEILKKGGKVVKGEVTEVICQGEGDQRGVESVRVKSVGGEDLSFKAKAVVLAMGPFLNGFCRKQFNFEYPLKNEIHAKALIRDPLGIFPQTAPFTLWNAPTELYWSEEERREIEKNKDLEWMLKPISPADHLRPLSDDEAGGPERFGPPLPS